MWENDLKYQRKEKRKLLALPRKIIASEFYEAIGISRAKFYVCVDLIRKANGLKSKHQPHKISDL